MLILSRREAEKVLFPGLGISVEITRVQGRSVRLGIQAPDEIRIIRGELEGTADLKTRKRNRVESKSLSASPPAIQKCLDAANLAIHLAQNQLRQNLTEKAEDALNHALECLETLQKVAGTTEETNLSSTSVNEAQSDYRLNRKKVALIVNDIDYSPEQLIDQLSSLGYQTTHFNHGESLIEFLQSREQPDLILLLSPAQLIGTTTAQQIDPLTLQTTTNVSASEITPEQSTPGQMFEHSSLRMFGVGSLQRSSRTYVRQDIEVTSWFADTCDESAAASCFS
jgi:carbon storage regulator CsrA